MSEEEPIQEPAAPVSMKEMVFPCMFFFLTGGKIHFMHFLNSESFL